MLLSIFKTKRKTLSTILSNKDDFIGAVGDLCQIMNVSFSVKKFPLMLLFAVWNHRRRKYKAKILSRNENAISKVHAKGTLQGMITSDKPLDILINIPFPTYDDIIAQSFKNMELRSFLLVSGMNIFALNLVWNWTIGITSNCTCFIRYGLLRSLIS